MNSSPFYPLMPLLELPRGYVVINIVVQILAGIATFALLCRLRIATIASLFGAVFFEFNGTFAWLSGGWGYALPALPLLVLGLEYSLDRQLKRKLIGMMTIAFAIALSISAGFIEIAFLDGLFGVGWAIVRLIALAGKDRAFVFGSMFGSAMVGLMLAAPILIASFDYLRVANVGMHTGAGNPSLNPIGLTQLVLPYAFGQILQIATIGTLMGFGRRLRGRCSLRARHIRGFRSIATFHTRVSGALDHSLPWGDVRAAALAESFHNRSGCAIHRIPPVSQCLLGICDDGPGSIRDRRYTRVAGTCGTHTNGARSWNPLRMRSYSVSAKCSGSRRQGYAGILFRVVRHLNRDRGSYHRASCRCIVLQRCRPSNDRYRYHRWRPDRRLLCTAEPFVSARRSHRTR